MWRLASYARCGPMWMPHNASHLCATSKALTCCLPPTLGAPAHGKTENTPKVKEITFVDLTPPGLKIIFGCIGSFVEFMTSVASWFSCESPCRSNNFVSLWMRYYLNSWTSQLHVNFDAGFSQPALEHLVRLWNPWALRGVMGSGAHA